MRYWLQIDHDNAKKEGAYKVILKTNSLERAINKLNKQNVCGFIWNCHQRTLAAKNY